MIFPEARAGSCSQGIGEALQDVRDIKAILSFREDG